MAKGGASGDWLVAMELFERGGSSPSDFVDALRQIDDADTLGGIAAGWIQDERPQARRMLFEYLDRPLNAYRHEALIKRLFKLAEAANDDELMGQFLVAFDRLVRRTSGRTAHREYHTTETEPEANALAAAWRDRGYEGVTVCRAWNKKFRVSGFWTESVLKGQRNHAMPRGVMKDAFDWNAKLGHQKFKVPDWVYSLKLIPSDFRELPVLSTARLKQLERFRLFSPATRYYLRRRAWRYFRRLGRQHPERYIAAVTDALLRYRDADLPDGIALLDSWGLMHILFCFSPCLVKNERGWNVAEGHSLAELEPSPKYVGLWRSSPRSLVELLIRGRCRAVRGWAVGMIRRDLANVLPHFSLDERLSLLGDEDPVVVALVAELLRDDPRLKDISTERWFSLLETAGTPALEMLGQLIEQYVNPDEVTIDQIVRLMTARPLPVARLGLHYLQNTTPRDEAECAAVGVIEAESEPLRPQIAVAAREALARSGRFDAAWILDWLDCGHAEIRTQGWTWFLMEPRACDDVTIRQRLLESPYDDVRLALIGELESRTRRLDLPELSGALNDELLGLLWASVLLNVRRGGRAKPIVIQQLVRRVQTHPADLARLLPLFAVALRSVRGPEWRSGLAAVVKLADRDESSSRLIEAAFPELQLS